MNCENCNKEIPAELMTRQNKKYCCSRCQKTAERRRWRAKKIENAPKKEVSGKAKTLENPIKWDVPIANVVKKGRRIGSKGKTPIKRDPNGEYSKRISKDPSHVYKTSVQRLVQNAVKRGEIIKPKKCERCGRETRIVAHHFRGYDHPYAIIWLCSPCHWEAHRLNPHLAK